LRGGNKPFRCSTRYESEVVAGDKDETLGVVESRRIEMFLHSVQDIIEQGGLLFCSSRTASSPLALVCRRKLGHHVITCWQANPPPPRPKCPPPTPCAHKILSISANIVGCTSACLVLMDRKQPLTSPEMNLSRCSPRMSKPDLGS